MLPSYLTWTHPSTATEYSIGMEMKDRKPCYVPVAKTDCRTVGAYLIQWTSDRRATLDEEISQ